MRSALCLTAALLTFAACSAPVVPAVACEGDCQCSGTSCSGASADSGAQLPVMASFHFDAAVGVATAEHPAVSEPPSTGASFFFPPG